MTPWDGFRRADRMGEGSDLLASSDEDPDEFEALRVRDARLAQIECDDPQSLNGCSSGNP